MLDLGGKNMAMTKKKTIILVSGMLLIFQFLSIAKAFASSSVTEPGLPRPPIFPGDEPPAIPDSPFIESLTPKQLYSLLAHVLVTEAICSRPGSCNWNPRADLNFDSAVDIFDAIIVAKNC
jgi:hypothetical protein